MTEVSEGQTLASESHIVAYEIDRALRRVFPNRISPEHMVQLQLLGEGFEHADPLLNLLDFLELEGDPSDVEQKFLVGLRELRATFVRWNQFGKTSSQLSTGMKFRRRSLKDLGRIVFETFFATSPAFPLTSTCIDSGRKTRIYA